jgi:uncharacterized protein YraI
MKLRGILWFSAALLFILILLSGCSWDLCTVNIPYNPPVVTEPNVYAEPGMVTFRWHYPYPLWCDTDYYALTVWEYSQEYNQVPSPDAVTLSTREKEILFPTPLEPGKIYTYTLTHNRKSITGPDHSGRANTGYIYTGPRCDSLDELVPVELVTPGNEQLLLQSTYGRWLFQDPNICYLGDGGNYHMQMGPDANFNNTIFDIENLWPNNEANASFENEFCVPYYWHVTMDFEDVARTDLDSGTNRFYIYPFEYDTVQPVNLLSPADHAFIPAEELNFDWEEPTTCNRIFMYEIQVSEQEDFSSYAYQMNSRILDSTTGNRPRPDLEVCTQYYWRIMTDPPSDSDNVYSETRRFVLSDPQGPCPIVVPEITLIPLDQLLITPTPKMNTLIPSVTAQVNLNCRAGPGSVYKIDDTLMAGMTALVEGRNDESTWWYIYLENHKRHCWVWGAQAEFNGDINQVRFLIAPPTPIPDQPVCSTFMDEKTCELNPSCKWVSSVSSVSAAPYCTDK